ncbi:hypothetical protein [Haloplanus salilacus]|uniref:hypothetical protein n=1 Tax=Haloplanus salilacus TaxID=2949994 RepID=UPI0030D24631
MDRRPTNRDGHPVDPVPFVVVAGLGAMLTLSAGPLYGLAYGLSLRTGVAAAAAVTASLIVGAYYQFVWRAAPDAVDGAGTDATRLYYMGLALGAVILALSLPLF